MKKVISVVCGILCAVSEISAMPDVKAYSDTIIMSNYGTSDSIVLGPDCAANITVADSENRDSLRDLELELYGPDGKKVAEWKGNNEFTFVNFDDSVKLIDDLDKYRISYDNFENPFGESGTIKEIRYQKATDGNYYRVVYNDYIDVEGNKEYRILLKYLIDKPVEFTVPAHSFGIYADKAWKNRIVDWYFSVIPDGADSNYDRYKHYFKDSAGELKIETLEDGIYNNRLGYDYKYSGGAGSVSRDTTIDDKAYEYVKTTINLSETFPGLFEKDGTYNIEFMGTDYNVDFSKDQTDPVMSAGVCFLSGNLVCAPFPDSDGNVTIYVEKETRKFSLVTDFMISDGKSIGSGGGKSGVPAEDYSVVEKSCKTVKLPSYGINIQAVNPGTYTLKIKNHPEYYDIVSGSEFTIKHYDKLEENAEYVKNQLVITHHGNMFSISDSENGKINADADLSKKIYAGDSITLTPEPDKGYRLLKYIFSAPSSQTEETVYTSKKYDYTMPDCDIVAKPVFRKTGDINGDDSVSVTDAVILQKMLNMSDEEYDTEQKITADINEDSKINIFDLIRLKRIMLGDD